MPTLSYPLLLVPHNDNNNNSSNAIATTVATTSQCGMDLSQSPSPLSRPIRLPVLPLVQPDSLPSDPAVLSATGGGISIIDLSRRCSALDSSSGEELVTIGGEDGDVFVGRASNSPHVPLLRKKARLDLERTPTVESISSYSSLGEAECRGGNIQLEGQNSTVHGRDVDGDPIEVGWRKSFWPFQHVEWPPSSPDLNPLQT